MHNLLIKAKEIAETADVTTLSGRAVVYSVSFMPDENNKRRAENLCASNKEYKLLDNTPCGQALISLGLKGKVNEVAEEITAVWKIASARFIAAASGNITAYVDGADERSTFCTTELQKILQNPHITSINNLKKEDFAASFHAKHYRKV